MPGLSGLNKGTSLQTLQRMESWAVREAARVMRMAREMDLGRTFTDSIARYSEARQLHVGGSLE